MNDPKNGKRVLLVIMLKYNGVMVFKATFNKILAILWLSVLLVKETGVPKATFNKILVISWLSVLLVKETGVHVPGENHPPTASHSQTLSYNVVSSRPRLCRI